MLTPREQTIFRNRFNHFWRINKRTALTQTVKWFESWYIELVGQEPPQDYKEEVIAFLTELETKTEEER